MLYSNSRFISLERPLFKLFQGLKRYLSVFVYDGVKTHLSFGLSVIGMLVFLLITADRIKMRNKDYFAPELLVYSDLVKAAHQVRYSLALEEKYPMLLDHSFSCFRDSVERVETLVDKVYQEDVPINERKILELANQVKSMLGADHLLANKF